MKIKSLLALLAVLLLSGSLSLMAQEDGGQDTENLDDEDSITLTVDGLERSFYAHVPPAYDEAESYPLVIGLHGAGGSAVDMAYFTDMIGLADEYGFLLAFPNAVDARWSYLDVPLDAGDPNVDDVKFISEMIDWFGTTYSLDADRVYAMGYSNGGLMATRLRCSLQDKVTAIAVVGATMTFGLAQECLEADPMPYMLILGTQDTAFPWMGITQIEDGILYGSFSLAQTTSFMGSLNRCIAQPEVEPVAIEESPVGVLEQSYTQCAEEMLLYALIDFGHDWPSTPRIVLRYGAVGTIEQGMWEFFERHTRAGDN